MFCSQSFRHLSFIIRLTTCYTFRYRLGPRWQSWVQYFLIDPNLHLLLLINEDMPLTIEETARDLNLTKSGKNFYGEPIFFTATSVSPVMIQRIQLIPPAWVVKSGKTNSDMYLSDWESQYCNAGDPNEIFHFESIKLL